ncbi:MAG: hypothetical protein EOM25_04755 [Deltaproteobacteria bacterium]|nr:hypothetical protein [Deltaproteobacteria bacterium]
MDPAALIPDALPIPVAWGWFYGFLFLTFTLHLLVMNIMLGSSIIALVHHARGKVDTEPLTVDISKKLPFTIAFAVNFGVAPLLFLQVLYGQFLYTSSVLMASYWLAVVGLVIVAYLAAYLYDFKYSSLGALKTALLLTATLCLLATAFIYTNNMTLMLTPEAWVDYFDRPGGNILNLGDRTLLPRYLHFVVASMAMAGLFMAMVWSHKAGKGEPDAQRWVRHGMTWFAYATMAQIAVGLWFLASLPQSMVLLFMGGSGLHTGVLLVGSALGVAAAVTALQMRLKLTVGLLLATTVAMVYLRDLVRDAYLNPYFQVGSRQVTGEALPLFLFVIVLAVGLVVVAWMLKLAADAGKEVQS